MRNLSYLALLAAVLGLALARCGHWPNDWTTTQYLFSYEAGFVKRALFGTLIQFVEGSDRYDLQTLRRIGVEVLVAVLGGLALRAIRHRDAYFLLLMAAPAGGYFIYLVGYLDHVLYGLVLAGLAAMRWRPTWALPASLALGLVSILVHEGALLLTVPLLVYGALLHRGPTAGRQALAVLGILAVAAVLVSTAGRLPPAGVPAWTQRVLGHAHFHIRPDAITVLSATGGETLSNMRRCWAEGDCETHLRHALPLTLLFGFWFLDAIVRAGAGLDRWTRVAGLAAAAAPLGMCVLGLDIERWMTLTTLNAWLVLTTTVDATREPKAPLPFSYGNIVLAFLIAIGAATSYPQFNGRPMRMPPFYQGEVH